MGHVGRNIILSLLTLKIASYLTSKKGSFGNKRELQSWQISCSKTRGKSREQRRGNALLKRRGELGRPLQTKSPVESTENSKYSGFSVAELLGGTQKAFLPLPGI